MTGRSAEAARTTIELDGSSLDIAAVTAVARFGAGVTVSPVARDRVEASSQRASRVIASGAHVYGRTTGVGAKLLEPVPATEARHHSLALLRSHAGGVGRVLDRAQTRALLVVRANQLLAGGAGIEPVVVDRIVAALESGATPVVHAVGGIGTGDLTALAEVGLALAGEGVWHDGDSPPPPVEFGAGDGLALDVEQRVHPRACGAPGNRRSPPCRLGRCSGRAERVGVWRQPRRFRSPRARARPFRGPSISARRVREVLGDGLPGVAASLQDPFGLRCAPQLNGAAQDSLDRLVGLVEVDINAAAENPLIAGDGCTGAIAGDDGDVALGDGNFLTSELAVALDQVRSTLAGVGLGSLARLSLACDPSMTGVTRFLTDGTPGASGVMILEYTAQSAMDRLRLAATSTSCWPVTVSAGIEHLASHAPLGVEQLGTPSMPSASWSAPSFVAAVRGSGSEGLPNDPGGGPGSSEPAPCCRATSPIGRSVRTSRPPPRSSWRDRPTSRICDVIRRVDARAGLEPLAVRPTP